MKSLVALFLLGFVCIAGAARCPYGCTQRVSYKTSCGWFGWSRCTKYRNEAKTCYKTCVHGGWSAWTTKTEGACSKSCGGGVQTVTLQRFCNDPSPSNGGNPCSGDSEKTERRSCNTQNCPINGGWSAFVTDRVGACSVTCGGGTQTVTSRRTCTNPAPRYGGSNCRGDATRITRQACNTSPCPVHGGWSAYQVETIGECSVTCGGGQQSVTSRRTCSNPTPRYGGRNCQGSGTKVESRSCNSNHCPINGGWSAYRVESTGECSVTCGGGNQAVTSRRTCNNPLPQYGGRDCQGSGTKVESQSCNSNPCPIDGGWSDYEVEDIAECSVTCGGGNQALTSSRTCNNPPPQYGGSDCQGDETKVESQSCNSNPCPIDGGWSDYEVEDIAECSVTCGGGNRAVTSRRTCNNPPPQYGGSDCQGDETKVESQSCNSNPCPIDGGWSDYEVEDIAECSVTCGGGNRAVTSGRTCNNPPPQYGGSECEGNATKVEYQDCNPNPCPVDGGWSDWDDWQDYDECSALCGGGTKDQWRTRRCDSPAPAYGGRDCEGVDKENGTVDCNTQACGDRCPEGANTYVANTNNAGRYYQCVHGVAILMDCADGTVWDQSTKVCVRDVSSAIECPAGTVWDQATTSCIHDGSQQVKQGLQNGDQCDPSVMFSAHQDCTKYFMCLHGTAREMSCPKGLRFRSAISACDWASNVPCDN